MMSKLKAEGENKKGANKEMTNTHKPFYPHTPKNNQVPILLFFGSPHLFGRCGEGEKKEKKKANKVAKR